VIDSGVLTSSTTIGIASIAWLIGVLGSAGCLRWRDWREAHAIGLSVWEFRHGRRRWLSSIAALAALPQDMSLQDNCDQVVNDQRPPVDTAPHAVPEKLREVNRPSLALAHAQALLETLQARGAGEPSHVEVENSYHAMCEERGWKARPWMPIGNQLRQLTGGAKQYRWRDGRQVRVYKISEDHSTAGRSSLRKAA
jgi:hypothetical protein